MTIQAVTNCSSAVVMRNRGRFKRLDDGPQHSFIELLVGVRVVKLEQFTKRAGWARSGTLHYDSSILLFGAVAAVTFSGFVPTMNDNQSYLCSVTCVA